MNELLFAASEGAHGGGDGFLTEYMWLVPLLPFLSFFVTLFFGRRFRNRGHAFGIAAVGIGFVMSLIAFVELAAGNAAVEKHWE